MTEQLPGQLDLSPELDLSETQIRALLTAKQRERDRTRGELLDQLPRLLADDAAAGDAVRAAVRAARQLGATWQQIADAAGITRQSAWKRWATPTDHDHGRHVVGGRCTVCGAEVKLP